MWKLGEFVVSKLWLGVRDGADPVRFTTRVRKFLSFLRTEDAALAANR